MRQSSLRTRLLITAAISIGLALIIAAFSLIALFQQHVERRIDAELETYISQMIGHIELTADGRIHLSQELADARFKRPLSGLYWQIQDQRQPTLLRSRSLWDAVLTLPGDELEPGIVHRHRLQGPARQTLLVRERQIIFQTDAEARRLRIAVAVDRQELIASRNAFSLDMLPYLAAIALLLMSASWLQVRIGLSPLDAVRRGVSMIRSGTEQRLSGRYPEEVMPLVSEVNALLDSQEQSIERARAWTADLAHGLKTPLTVLSADAQRLREQGMPAIADDLDQLAENMRRRVDRELIRARVRSGMSNQQMRTELKPVIDGILRTLKRTPLGEALHWSASVPEQTYVSLLPDDLAELLGNLLENATQWAKSAVRISIETHSNIIIHIEDDGPGVADEHLANLCARGVRLDEGKQGSGLGLAIAQDIIEAYRGKLSLGRSELGGLAVVISI